MRLLLPLLALAAPPATSGAPSAAPPDPAPGISEALAAERAARVRDLRYDLAFRLPADPGAPVDGRAVLSFTLRDARAPLVIDFEEAASRVRSVTRAGRPVRWRAVAGHLVVAPASLAAGPNRIEIQFTAGDAPLNRNPEFLHTLFVPARAHLAFPCLDQPDLKGRFTLALELPAGWEAVANGAELSREPRGDGVLVRFAETPPLPTYLFSFAAGRFQVETGTRGARTFRMLHRETDPERVARNRDAIFDLHGAALDWMERYTGIPLPYGKYDFVLVPSFQFGGMEHPGAVLYKASTLLLDATATVEQRLDRASLIAHEVSHMWFGDLVTMRWFDDVWLKEVFANFLAARIVDPSFPTVNHALRFLYAHYPAAYGVDRTTGANPIRQHLANLSEAGTLYGAIVYQKAPVVMRNVESMLGPDRLRDGLREYLRTFAHGNASWPELVDVLSRHAGRDLRPWSRAWVEEAGRPTLRTELAVTDGRIASLAVTQEDPAGRGRHWGQRIAVTVGFPEGERTFEADLQGARAEVQGAAGLPAPRWVLPNGKGIAYGMVRLDGASRDWLVGHLPGIADPLTRGAAWVTLWDELLAGDVGPEAFLSLALDALPREGDALTTLRVLGYLRAAWWRFLPANARTRLAPRLEGVLREGLATARAPSDKAAWFNALRDTAITPDALAWLRRIWSRDEGVPGMGLEEPDEIALALELAVREVPGWREVVEGQLARTRNPDRRAQLAFVAPAVDADPAVRRAFFERLGDVSSRRREAWVVEGLAYLNHPLRALPSEGFLAPGLALLREIQRTGDIFFPKRWTDALLAGHASPAAAAAVRSFLSGLPASYPPRLRMVVEASADPLIRAARLAGPGVPPPPP